MVARAAMTLFALFCFLGEANAQKTLPYEYGFEKGDPVTEGWSMVDCDKQSEIYAGSSMGGHYLFDFHPNKDHDQYLISPELDSSAPISVLFYYKVADPGISAIFEVGYSTTTNDVSAFTWDLPRTYYSPDKHPYANTYPAGTKYIAIKYRSFSDTWLNIDSFSFTQAEPVSLPYEFGCENYPEEEGWIYVNCDLSTDQWYSPGNTHTGNRCFRFYHGSNNAPQCLITPMFSGNAEILMSFWYKGGSPFQIGYSTTTKSPDAFTWGNEVTANDETQWKQYQAIFPEGTKYVAVKHTSYDQLSLGLDDFCFEEATAIPGDVNGDGSVNISDVTALVNIILGKGTDENGTADVNNDGSVNISDVTALVNIILGK